MGAPGPFGSGRGLGPDGTCPTVPGPDRNPGPGTAFGTSPGSSPGSGPGPDPVVGVVGGVDIIK